MDSLAVDCVRARVAKSRAAEMLARGWTILGPAGEGMLMMEGPDPDLEPTPAPSPMAAFVRPMVTRARLRAQVGMQAVGVHAGRAVIGEAA